MKQSKKTALAAVMAGAVALGMISAVSAGSAAAYFTTYATARGGHTIHLGNRTQIREEFSRWTKHVSLRNTGEKEAYVRVKVFAGREYDLTYSGSEKWSAGEDGYWYYEELLPVGEETEILDVGIELPVITDEAGNNVAYTEDFNVVVIQECTAVRYKEDGTPYADWDAVLDSGKEGYEWEEGGAGNE